MASKLRSSELYGIQAFNAMPDRLRQQRFRRDNSRVLERSYAAAAGDLMNMPKSDHRMVVLAVEDEPIVRMSMADFLDDAGFKVFEAVNADEAIALLQARSDVQVVVTDIEMPGSMNGLEMARVVRVRWPSVGIVVASGRVRPSPDDLMDGVVFLSKPYLPDAVISAIRQVTMPKHSN